MYCFLLTDCVVTHMAPLLCMWPLRVWAPLKGVAGVAATAFCDTVHLFFVVPQAGVYLAFPRPCGQCAGCVTAVAPTYCT